MQNLINESSVRSRMRIETQTYHVKLNQHPLLVELMKPHSPLSNYHKVLCAYFEIYQVLENRIDQFVKSTSCTYDYSERTKLPWLVQDLKFLHLYPIVQANPANQGVVFPEILSIGQLIGVLYVLEGATLGGQLIYAGLLKNHGLQSTRGARFFAGYGERSSLMWQDFIDFSEIISHNEVQCKAALVTASQTFKLFIQTLDEHIHFELQYSDKETL